VVIIWTFFALSPARDGYEVDSLGAFMLCGFLWILGLPLVLIIPYTTYRSLAQEYEDGTIDMVLITTMKPYQIIAGKLGSAMLQVLIYMAVLAPCISFCYLLRGVDISQIYYSIGGGLIVSFGLCCLAIALASAADSTRLVQVIAVFLILGLLFCGWMWCLLAWAICFAPMPANQRPLVNLMLAGPFLAWISTAIILFFAASAKIAFSSSNRSTMIRGGVLRMVACRDGGVWIQQVRVYVGFLFRDAIFVARRIDDDRLPSWDVAACAKIVADHRFPTFPVFVVHAGAGQGIPVRRRIGFRTKFHHGDCRDRELVV
jgi:hypothetical protein